MTSFIVKDGGSDFKQVDAGTYPARCIAIIDLGTQHSEWQGKPIARRQAMLQWELPTETIETKDGIKPMTVSKFYTVSLSEKSNLRPDLEAWRGRAFTPEELAGFDLNNVLDKPCMVSIIHNDKGKARVSSVAKLVKGMTVPNAFHAPFIFSLDNFDGNVFQALPEGIKKLIAQSDEYKGAFAPPEQGLGPDDGDIPF
jgi:hypothetical protein